MKVEIEVLKVVKESTVNASADQPWQFLIQSPMHTLWAEMCQNELVILTSPSTFVILLTIANPSEKHQMVSQNFFYICDCPKWNPEYLSVLLFPTIMIIKA